MAKNGKKRPAAAAGEKPKACYVLSLSVENVRCFGPKQTLDLSDGHGRPAQWTIILGENGTGKTTLLQSVVSFERRLRKWPNLPEHVLVEEPLIHAEDYSGPEARTDRYGFMRVSASKHVTACELAGTLAYDLCSATSQNQELKADWVLHGSLLKSHIPAGAGFIYYGYGASRRLLSTRLDDVDDADSVATLFDQTASVRSAENWLLRLDYAASKDGVTQEIQKQRREQVVTLLTSGLLPDITAVEFSTSLGANPKPRVNFETPFGWVPLRQLGYGYQTLIAWMLDFVSRMVERYPDSDDPLSEPAVCVVDEIDLHLHPAWQRKLIGFLSERFPNTQFIATAHSPLVVQAAENANIAVLKREGDHVVIRNDVDDIRNWRVDQILTSDLFGLESARSPEVERLIVRKQALLDKSRLSRAEKQELQTLQERIDRLPVGRSASENKELDAVRRALDALKATPPR